MNEPELIELRLEQSRRMLVLEYADGQRFELPCEYLRTHSPSAEVRGHGLSEPKLMTGKADVNIDAIVPIGAYAVELQFDDGHRTGIYSWSFLFELGVHQIRNQDRYRARLIEAGLASRSA
ncbi:MAG: gamma-butyrobetaine hydroxylase-like domain-containing protein [Pseudomonadota bacterium]